MLFDTDVLIWCFRGVAKAAKAIEADDAPSISVITYMELVQGVRDNRELKAVSHSRLPSCGLTFIWKRETVFR